MFDGQLKKLVCDADVVPGISGAVFDNIYPFDLAINSHGTFAFASGLRGSAVTNLSDVAIFRGTAEGVVEQVLREGSQAAGLDPSSSRIDIR